MANNQNLKNAIAAVIKTNGNNEITGQIMQDSLTAIINHFGKGDLFMGIATPATIPETSDVNLFYIASENGIYSNFNGYENINNDLIVFSNRTGVYTPFVFPIKTLVTNDFGNSESIAISQKAFTELRNESVLSSDIINSGSEFNLENYVIGSYVNSSGIVSPTNFGDMGFVDVPEDVDVVSVYIPRPAEVTVGKYLAWHDVSGAKVGSTSQISSSSTTVSLTKPIGAVRLYFTINQGSTLAPVEISPGGVIVQFSSAIDFSKVGISSIKGVNLMASTLANGALINESGNSQKSVLNIEKALEIFPVYKHGTKNLIVENSYLYPGSSVNNSLDIIPIAGYNLVYKLPIEPNKTYYIKAKNPTSTETVARRIRVSNSFGSIIQDIEHTDEVTTVNNAAFLTFTYYVEIPLLEIGVFEDEIQEWEPIGFSIRPRGDAQSSDPKDLATVDYVDSKAGDDFSYIKLWAAGDSSTATNSVAGALWPFTFQEQTGAQVVVAARGGATWRSDNPLTNCIEVQINNLLTSGYTPNVIVIQCGGNDIDAVRSLPSRLGTLEEAISDINYLNYDPTTTVYNAVRYNVERLKRAFPKAIIILGTTWQRFQYAADVYSTTNQIAQAIREMSEQLGVRMIDGFKHCGISWLTEIKNRNNFDEETGAYFDWVEPDGSVVSESDKTLDAIKRFGLYTYDGKHVYTGKNNVAKFMVSAIINEVVKSNIDTEEE